MLPYYALATNVRLSPTPSASATGATSVGKPSRSAAAVDDSSRRVDFFRPARPPARPPAAPTGDSGHKPVDKGQKRPEIASDGRIDPSQEKRT
jgi:hypothetical protein